MSNTETHQSETTTQSGTSIALSPSMAAARCIELYQKKYPDATLSLADASGLQKKPGAIAGGTRFGILFGPEAGWGIKYGFIPYLKRRDFIAVITVCDTNVSKWKIELYGNTQHQAVIENLCRILTSDFGIQVDITLNAPEPMSETFPGDNPF